MEKYVGMKWKDVKNDLEQFATVDDDNIHESGKCIVDFDNIPEIGISGQLDNSNELHIDDEEIIYNNEP